MTAAYRVREGWPRHVIASLIIFGALFASFGLETKILSLSSSKTTQPSAVATRCEST